MPDKPNLIIQLQRMGDLILSFPLFSWLIQSSSNRPLWVVAEPDFYNALMPLTPAVVFVPPQAVEALSKQAFHKLINLSHRPEAAELAGKTRAEQKFGRVTENGITRIHGSWQLYRASLIHNNRHNLFHWADLNALDIIDPNIFCMTKHVKPRQPGQNQRIGLFVGASQPEKRPEPKFWADLAQNLAQRGLKPVFLGGEAEKTLTSMAARLAGMPHVNLGGKFTLRELSDFIKQLDLLITPDTGPMHLAAWVGTLCLNLSMGPVNAWETAPFQPGHLILRPTISCVGCWQCSSSEPPCKARFLVERIASLTHKLFQPAHSLPRLPGLQLLQTGHTRQGLFQLTPVAEQSGEPDNAWMARYALGNFWRQWFLHILGWSNHDTRSALDFMANTHPVALQYLSKRLPPLQAAFTRAFRRQTLAADFWQSAPPLLRPAMSYLHLYMENHDFSHQAWLAAAEILENLSLTLAGSAA